MVQNGRVCMSVPMYTPWGVNSLIFATTMVCFADPFWIYWHSCRIHLWSREGFVCTCVCLCTYMWDHVISDSSLKHSNTLDALGEVGGYVSI